MLYLNWDGRGNGWYEAYGIQRPDGRNEYGAVYDEKQLPLHPFGSEECKGFTNTESGMWHFDCLPETIPILLNLQLIHDDLIPLTKLKGLSNVRYR